MLIGCNAALSRTNACAFPPQATSVTGPAFTVGAPMCQDKERRIKMVVARPEPASHKVCSRCGNDKPADSFYRDASKPDGLQVRPPAPCDLCGARPPLAQLPACTAAWHACGFTNLSKSPSAVFCSKSRQASSCCASCCRRCVYVYMQASSYCSKRMPVMGCLHMHVRRRTVLCLPAISGG